MIATVDLVGRTGATGLDIGYLHDDVPPDQADWYASVQYKGARIIVERQRGPIEALEELGKRLLTGAQCHHCKGLVALSPFGALAFNSTLADGRRWTVEDAKKAPQCLWKREGRHWVGGCATGD
jgi:hypothetical protein